MDALNFPGISKYVQHQKCAWEHKVNLIVHLDGEYGDPNEDGTPYIVREQVGARRIDNTTIELCCLPFFVYGYALGDILEVDPDTFQVIGPVSKSGRRLFRIFFNCDNSEVIKISNACKKQLGATLEWFNDKHCAVDIDSEANAEKFCELMWSLTDANILAFENG